MCKSLNFILRAIGEPQQSFRWKGGMKILGNFEKGQYGE